MSAGVLGVFGTRCYWNYLVVLNNVCHVFVC